MTALRHVTLVVVGAFVAACGGSTPGDDGGDDGGDDAPPIPGSYEDPLVQRGVVPRQGTSVFHPAEMLADGTTLYYCGSPGGLVILDVTNPGAPATRAILRPDDRRKCQHLATDATTIFATSRGDEMDPIPFVAGFDLTVTPPMPIGVYHGAGESFEGVAASGGQVYVAQHDAGIAVLTASGGTLTRIGALTTGFANAWDVAITGATLVVADSSFGLRTVDVANPAAPVLRGSLALPDGSPQAVIVADGLAYVALGAGGLAIVDVTNPASPVLLATADTPGSAVEIGFSAGKVFVADWDDVRVFDVANPAAPVLLASESVDRQGGQFTRFLGAAGSGDRGYWGEFAGQVYIYDLFPDRVAPEILPATSEITFRRTAPGGAAAYALIVRNEGRAPLAVTAIDVAGGVFMGDTSYFGLAPGAADVVEVQFNPTSTAQATGTVTFTTDDPDEPQLVVDLVGNKPGLQIGDPAPAVQVALLEGGTWDLASQQTGPVLLSYFATF